jgi:hypothetical protein
MSRTRIDRCGVYLTKFMFQYSISQIRTYPCHYPRPQLEQKGVINRSRKQPRQPRKKTLPTLRLMERTDGKPKKTTPGDQYNIHFRGSRWSKPEGRIFGMALEAFAAARKRHIWYGRRFCRVRLLGKYRRGRQPDLIRPCSAGLTKESTRCAGYRHLPHKTTS